MHIFLISLVAYLIGIQATSIGTLVFSSIKNANLSGPAFVALIQAFANSLALLTPSFLLTRFSIQNLMALTFGCSVLNLILSIFINDIQPVTFFLRILLGALGTGILLSNSPRLIHSDLKTGNQRIQIASSISALIGFSIAPIISSSLLNVYVIDSILNLVALISVLIFKKLEKEKLNETVITKTDVSISLEAVPYRVMIATFILWCFGGFFYVIEVPLLIHRFNLNQNQISAIFVGTLISNLIATTFTNKTFIEKHNKTILALASSIICIGCITYSITTSLTIVLLCISLIGIFNGIFNLAQSNILQKTETNKARLQSILIARLVAQLGIIAGAATAGAGITPNFKETKETKSIKEANILIRNLPSEIEPFKNSDTSSMLVLQQVFENLFEYDNNNNLIPILAESLTWKKNNLVLEIKLKKNVYFSNGDELEAEIVKNSINSARNYLGKTGNWAFGNLIKIDITDKKTVEFEFKKQFTIFPAILASPYLTIFKKDKNGNLIGTGDYKIKNINTNNATLVKAKDIKGPEVINFETQNNSGTQYTLSDTNVEGLIKHEIRTLQTYVLTPNTTKGPLSDKNTRCELINTLSKTALDVYSTWKPVEIGLPFSNVMLKKEPIYKFEKKTGKNRKIEILYADSTARFEEKLNYKIQEILKLKGFDIIFKKLKTTELANKGKSGDFNLLMFGFVPDFVHPHALLAPLTGTDEIYNFGKYSNKELDRLITKSLNINEKREQLANYTKAMNILESDCAISFLGSENNYVYLSPNIEKPTFGQLGIHNIKISELRLKNDIH